MCNYSCCFYGVRRLDCFQEKEKQQQLQSGSSGRRRRIISNCCCHSSNGSARSSSGRTCGLGIVNSRQLFKYLNTLALPLVMCLALQHQRAYGYIQALPDPVVLQPRKTCQQAINKRAQFVPHLDSGAGAGSRLRTSYMSIEGVQRCSCCSCERSLVACQVEACEGE